MGTTPLRFLAAGLLFLIIFLSGFSLSRSGTPYSVIVLTIHKLIAAAAVAYLVVIMIQANRAAALSPLEIIAGLAAGLAFLSLIATGAFLSSAREMPAVVSKLHQAAPYLTVLLSAATLYLLRGR